MMPWGQIPGLQLRVILIVSVSHVFKNSCLFLDLAFFTVNKISYLSFLHYSEQNSISFLFWYTELFLIKANNFNNPELVFFLDA